ncbi:MAG: ketoacyl-ACP synthase III [Actinomycetia bacterium]|nr:ketoacyl-ACP synthase III [Actinomycetes bacterium]MCP4225998.1 ketoacyl-ACP synthase III [Actinomycetes bacterium]MCP5030807.1 ketoacyl-ACP synthase III [Actinomycetes bacterium]
MTLAPWGMKLTGIGAALPEKVLTNQDLTAWMDTTDEWIHERTGIRERRIGGSTSGLATQAAQRALSDAGLEPESIDQIILATTSPDHICPGTAPAVARELGLQCGAFDLQAACSGWVYGIVMANGLLVQGMERILVIGAESLDRITDYHDRGTGILFGNGAGAAVVERDDTGRGQLLGWDLGSNGNYVHILYADHGDTLNMDGREVFRQAVSAIQKSAKATMAMAGVTADDIDFIIPHQANIRIVESAWKKLGFSMDKTGMVLEWTGNTSAASIPLALDDALANDRIKSGDLVMFCGFGAGMTWACTLIRWA